MGQKPVILFENSMIKTVKNLFVFPKIGNHVVTTVELLTTSSEAGEGGELLLFSIAMHTRLRWE